MKKRLLLVLPVLLGVFVSVSAQDFLLKAIAGNGSQIMGETILRGYENQVEVSSYSQGIASCPSTGGSGARSACRASISDLNLMIQLDRSVNAWRKAALTGEVLQSVELTILKGTGQQGPSRYYRLRMEDVIVTSVQESGSEGGSTPSVSLSLSGARIAWGYYRQRDDGSLGPVDTYGWDVAKNIFWNYIFN